MKCPYPQDPRWLLEYQYDHAYKAMSSLANAYVNLIQLKDFSDRWSGIADEFERFMDKFKKEYNNLLCELMKEKE